MAERIPFPEKVIGFVDIARGVGQVIVDSILRMPHELASHGNHFIDGIAEPPTVEGQTPEVDS